MNNSNKVRDEELQSPESIHCNSETGDKKKSSHSQRDNEYSSEVFNFQYIWANSYLTIIKRTVQFDWKWNTCVLISNLTQILVTVQEEKKHRFQMD